MKRLRISLIGAAMLGLAGVAFVARAESSAEAAAEKTRKELHQQGFKTDLTDFYTSPSEEMAARVAALGLTNRSPRPGSMAVIGNPDLMTPVGEHSVLVIWKQERLENPPGFAGIAYLFDKGTADDVWPVVRGEVEEEREKTDKAAEAVLSGPIEFHLNLGRAPILLPHVAALMRLAEKFSNRAVLALHDGDTNIAWTNLLACTRLATAWQMEPTEVSHRVRCNLVDTAYDLTWQALQAGGWPDEQLAQLQREWESLDLLKVLPDVVAFGGASDVALCRGERLRPVPTNAPMTNPLKSPTRAYNEFEKRMADSKYRETGTYVDEKDMLLFYRDRVLEARRAAQSHTWVEMRELPGVANEVEFQSQFKDHLSMGTLARSHRRLSRSLSGWGVGLMDQAAEAEARRRVVIVAIALERYHGRHKAYPKSLAELAPEFVKEVPVDFMDGKPLRYVTAGAGQFYLYSVGLDGVDDGGKLPPPLDSSEMSVARTSGGRPQVQGDLVWPVAGTAEEAKAYYAAKRKEEERRKNEVEQREADTEAAERDARQAAVKKLLADPRFKRVTWPGMGDGSKEPLYKGQPLSKFFANAAHATSQISLTEMLMLKRIGGEADRGVLEFQLPISYDALTNRHGGTVALLVDSDPDAEYGRQSEWQNTERATNGDVLLWWNVATDVPGEHALQALLRVELGIDERSLEIKGPVLRYVNTNLIQFFPESGPFNDTGANLYARLAESNAVYNIEIKTQKGAHLKTITGSTTNGMINAEWDLQDDKGQKYAGHSFESVFSVTLKHSGRSQTLTQGQSKIGTAGD